jgi:hypothetical protein
MMAVRAGARRGAGRGEAARAFRLDGLGHMMPARGHWGEGEASKGRPACSGTQKARCTHGSVHFRWRSWRSAPPPSSFLLWPPPWGLTTPVLPKRASTYLPAARTSIPCFVPARSSRPAGSCWWTTCARRRSRCCRCLRRRRASPKNCWWEGWSDGTAGPRTRRSRGRTSERQLAESHLLLPPSFDKERREAPRLDYPPPSRSSTWAACSRPSSAWRPRGASATAAGRHNPRAGHFSIPLAGAHVLAPAAARGLTHG